MATENIVNLVVVKFGVGDFQVMHFSRCPVFLFQHRADLAARLGPRLHVRHGAPQKSSGRVDDDPSGVEAKRVLSIRSCDLQGKPLFKRPAYAEPLVGGRI